VSSPRRASTSGLNFSVPTQTSGIWPVTPLSACGRRRRWRRLPRRAPSAKKIPRAPAIWVGPGPGWVVLAERRGGVGSALRAAVFFGTMIGVMPPSNAPSAAELKPMTTRRTNASHRRRRSARSSAGLATRLRAPAADLPSEVIGVKVENRTNILEREAWLAAPALDPLLGLPAEQAGREIPGVLASSETSDRIRENRKRQPHVARLCGTTWQRLDGAGPKPILALRKRAALKTHDGAPPKSRVLASTIRTVARGGCQSVESGIRDAKLP